MAEYSKPLARLTAGYAWSRVDREDLMQEIYMDLWQSLPYFRGECSERTWVYRIAHNVAVSFSVRRQRRREHEFQDGADARPTPEGEYEQAERHALLVRSVRWMSRTSRSCFPTWKVCGLLRLPRSSACRREQWPLV